MEKPTYTAINSARRGVAAQLRTFDSAITSLTELSGDDMALSEFKQQIEEELRRVIDITLKQGVTPSRAAMVTIMRHEITRIAEIRAAWGDPNVCIVDGNFAPSGEVAAFADNMVDHLLGPEE